MGSFGNDGIAGGSHNDDLSGNDGDDVIQGDSGNDRLAGGTGLNFLTGGSGRDIFICDPQGETHVTDFEPRTDSMSGPCILSDATTNAGSNRNLNSSTASTTPTSRHHHHHATGDIASAAKLKTSQPSSIFY